MLDLGAGSKINLDQLAAKIRWAHKLVQHTKDMSKRVKPWMAPKNKTKAMKSESSAPSKGGDDSEDADNKGEESEEEEPAMKAMKA